MTPLKSYLLSHCHCCGVARHVEFLAVDSPVVEIPVLLTGFRVRRRLPERGGVAEVRIEIDRRWLVFEGSVSDVDLETVGLSRPHRFPSPVFLEAGKHLRVTVEDPYVAAGLKVEFLGEVADGVLERRLTQDIDAAVKELAAVRTLKGPKS